MHIDYRLHPALLERLEFEVGFKWIFRNMRLLPFQRNGEFVKVRIGHERYKKVFQNRKKGRIQSIIYVQPKFQPFLLKFGFLTLISIGGTFLGLFTTPKVVSNSMDMAQTK